jgi:hypothetical protein
VLGQRAAAEHRFDATAADQLAGLAEHFPFAEPEIELPVLGGRAAGDRR